MKKNDAYDSDQAKILQDPYDELLQHDERSCNESIVLQPCAQFQLKLKCLNKTYRVNFLEKLKLQVFHVRNLLCT